MISCHWYPLICINYSILTLFFIKRAGGIHPPPSKNIFWNFWNLTDLVYLALCYFYFHKFSEPLTIFHKIGRTMSGENKYLRLDLWKKRKKMRHFLLICLFIPIISTYPGYSAGLWCGFFKKQDCTVKVIEYGSRILIVFVKYAIRNKGKV